MKTYGILLIIIGVFTSYRAISWFRNGELASKSLKAQIWSKFVGIDKATVLTQNIFAPLGMAIGLAIVILGTYLVALEY